MKNKNEIEILIGIVEQYRGKFFMTKYTRQQQNILYYLDSNPTLLLMKYLPIFTMNYTKPSKMKKRKKYKWQLVL